MEKTSDLIKEVKCEYGQVHRVMSVYDIIEPYKCTKPQEHKKEKKNVDNGSNK